MLVNISVMVLFRHSNECSRMFLDILLFALSRGYSFYKLLSCHSAGSNTVVVQSSLSG